MPAIVGGFHKQAEAGDPEDLVRTAGTVQQPDTAVGNNVLGRIFDSKDVSRQVADHAFGQTGVSSTVLKTILPIIATAVARHLGSNRGSSTEGEVGGGGLGGMLGSILGGNAGGAGGLGGLGGLGGFTDGGTNPLDEIIRGTRR